jgi:hypothetical protein
MRRIDHAASQINLYLFAVAIGWRIRVASSSDLRQGARDSQSVIG